MKKVLLAGAVVAAQMASPALAADWPVMAPTYEAAPPPAVYSWWTGCYLGGNAGGAWGRPFYTHDNGVVVEDFTFTPVALIGGGQLGCQYQWNSVVFGLEGTYSWANLRQAQPSTLLPNRETVDRNRPDWHYRRASSVMPGTAPCYMPRAAGLV